MLTLMSVNPTGMFSNGYCKDVDLQNKGLIHLVGINHDKGDCSNGAGKTSLFNSICEVMFGENPTGEKGDAVINNVWDKGFCGRIMFSSWENQVYRVTYCRKWKEEYYPVDNDNSVEYTGTTLYLDKYEDGRWRDLRGNSMADTRSRIQEAVGMTYSQFVSISYMSHRIGNAFLRGTNKEKIDLLSGITGIEEWDQVSDACRKEKKGLTASISSTDTKISFSLGQVQTLESTLGQLKAENWDQKKQEYSENLVANHALKTTINQHVVKEQEVLLDLERRKAVAADSLEIKAVQTEIDALQAELRRVGSRRFAETEAEAKALYADLTRLTEEKAEATSKVNMIVGQLSVLERDSRIILQDDKCPTCGSKISKAKKDKYQKSIDMSKKELEQLSAKVQELDSLIRQEEETIFRKKAEFTTAIGIESLAVQEKISKEQAELSMLLSAKDKFDPSIRECNVNILNYQKQLGTVLQDKSNLEYWVNQCDENLKKMVELGTQILSKKGEITDLEGSKKDIESEIVVLDWLISNIPYIKLHKLSLSMKELSDLTNGNLSAMGETIRVDISAFDLKKSKKTGADFTEILKSDIKVLIKDGTKEIPTRLYSEGETGTISNAIVRALHDLAGQLGYGCNVTLLDEIFAFIDSSNSQKLAQSFTMPTGSTVFITDNSGNVENYINFNETIIAEKSGGITSYTS